MKEVKSGKERKEVGTGKERKEIGSGKERKDLVERENSKEKEEGKQNGSKVKRRLSSRERKGIKEPSESDSDNEISGIEKVKEKAQERRFECRSEYTRGQSPDFTNGKNKKK